MNARRPRFSATVAMPKRQIIKSQCPLIEILLYLPFYQSFHNANSTPHFLMKVYVTFERAIKEFEIPDDHNFIGEVKKQCCPYFNVQPEEVVMRSGTRPIREDMPLRKDHSITMARIKSAK